MITKLKNKEWGILIGVVVLIALAVSLAAVSITGNALSDIDQISGCEKKQINLNSLNKPSLDIILLGNGYMVSLESASDSSATITVTDQYNNSDTKEITEESTKDILGVRIYLANSDESTRRMKAKLFASLCEKTQENSITYLDPTACEFKIATPNTLFNSTDYAGSTDFRCNSGEVIGSITHIDCPNYFRDNRIIVGTGWHDNQIPSTISYSCAEQSTGVQTAPLSIYGYCCQIKGAQTSVKSVGQKMTTSVDQNGELTRS